MGQKIFLDNFLADLLSKSQKELGLMAYSTEPMKEIEELETDERHMLYGLSIDFNKIPIDGDVLETYRE